MGTTTFDEAMATPVLVHVGKEEYECSPLDIDAWGYLIAWVRSSILQTAGQAADGMSDRQGERLMKMAYAQASRVGLHHLTAGARPDLATAKDQMVEAVREAGDEAAIDQAVGLFAEAVLTSEGQGTDDTAVVQGRLATPEGLAAMLTASVRVKHGHVSAERGRKIAQNMTEDLGAVIGQIMLRSLASTDPNRARALMESPDAPSTNSTGEKSSETSPTTTDGPPSESEG